MDEERRKRMKEAMNRPEVKEKNRLGAIRQHTKMTEEQKEEYSRKISEAVRRRYTEDPTYRERVSRAARNEWQDPAYRKRVMEHIAESKLRPAVKAHMSEGQRRRFSSLEERDKASFRMLRKWEDDSYVEAQVKVRRIRPSGMEQHLLHILDEIVPGVFKYVGDWRKGYWFRRNGKSANPDFINDTKRLIVELFGDPRLYNGEEEEERARIEYFTQFGYRTLVIWGNELRFNVDEMKKKIINFVDSRNSIGKVA